MKTTLDLLNEQLLEAIGTMVTLEEDPNEKYSGQQWRKLTTLREAINHYLASEELE